MPQLLKDRRIAILATDGFEQSELVEPKRALNAAGARVDVVAPKAGSIRGWKTDDWGDEVAVDVPLAEAQAEAYDALVLPGGVLNPDHLRTDAARSVSCAASSSSTSRWRRSATAPGRWSRPTFSRAAG
jgi:protease I